MATPKWMRNVEHFLETGEDLPPPPKVKKKKAGRPPKLGRKIDWTQRWYRKHPRTIENKLIRRAYRHERFTRKYYHRRAKQFIKNFFTAMKPKGNWLSYEDAKTFLHKELIHSRNAYEVWYKFNKPRTIPRWPYRVYIDEWKGWNDFLGNNNERFRPMTRERLENGDYHHYRPLSECKAFARKLGFATMEEWLEWVRENKETMPKDVPRRPDLFYEDWMSWKDFFGKSTADRAIEIQDGKDPSVFYVYHDNDDPPNVLRFSIAKEGVSEIMDLWNDTRSFSVTKMYKYAPRLLAEIQQLIGRMTSSYYGSNTTRIVPNQPQLLAEIERIMPVVAVPTRYR